MKWCGVVLVLGISMSLYGQSRSWQETISMPGRFRVMAPQVLQEKTDTIYTKLGALVYHTFFFQSPDKLADNLFYMVSYCDYPPGTVHSDSSDLVEAFFDATVEEAAFSINGKLIYSEPATFQSYPGRIWRVEYLKGEAIIKTRAYLVNNRYYAIQTVMLKDKSLNQATDRFFSSFQIWEPPGRSSQRTTRGKH